VTALYNLAEYRVRNIETGAFEVALASWSAVALLRRFSPERGGVYDKDSPVVRFTRPYKAPEGWRSPQPGGLPHALTSDRWLATDN